MEDAYPTSRLQRFALFINFFFPCLAMTVLCLRLYGKASHPSRGPGTFRHPSVLLGPDDVFACVSMMLSIGLTIASYYYIKTNYVGIDPDDIPRPYRFRVASIWMYVVQVLYYPVLAFIKSSVLFFLLRLGGQRRAVYRAICFLNALNLAMMVAVLIVVVMQCRPITFFWDKTVAGGTCINQPTFYLWQAGLNILTDLFALGVPICIFFNMKMERRMRIVTLYVFLLGFIVTVIATLRFVFLYILFFHDISRMDNYSMSFCLSSVETNLAIVCACAPTLRGLVRSWFPRALGPDPSATNPHGENDDDDNTAAFSSDAKPANAAVAAGRESTRRSNRPGADGGAFAYPKDGRGRVLCSHAEVDGLGITPSEEDIMRSNGILRTTDVVVEHGEEKRSLTRADTADGRPQRNHRGSGASYGS